MAFLFLLSLVFQACAEPEEMFDGFTFDIMPDAPADGLEADPAADLSGESDTAADNAPDFPPDPAGEDPEADWPVDGSDAGDSIDPAMDPEPDPDVDDVPVDDPVEEDPACGSSVCRSGETCCYGMICADLANDVDNCGTCGNICWSSEADSCVAGSCICSGSSRKCTGSYDDYCCESDGCRDLWTDDDHCGMCGWWCSSGEDCVSGWCEGW